MPPHPVDLARHRERRAERLAALEVASRAEAKAKADAEAALPLVRLARLDRGEVHCPRCKAPISGQRQRCPHCGVHFNSRAADFAPPEPKALWARLVAGAIALSLLAAAVTGAWPWL